MEKIFRGFLALIVIFSLMQASAGIEPENQHRTITHKIGTNTATVDGKQTRLSVPTEIRSGTTFIFSADLGKLLGLKFPWSPGNRMAGGVDPLTNTSLSFKDNVALATIDGDTFKLAVKPYIKKVGKDEYFMIPLIFSCEVFGCIFAFNDKKELSINKPLAIASVSWTLDGRDETRRYSVPNGTAPKGEEMVSDWKLVNGGEETSPLFFDRKVLFNDQSGWTCYDTKTKAQIWKIDNKADSIGKFALLQQLSYAQGKVFSGIGPTALDCATGKVVWQANETNIGECIAFGNTVLAWKSVPINENQAKYTVYSFNATTGAVNWKIDDFEWSFRSSWVARWKDRLLVKNRCFDLATGKKLFEIIGLPNDEKHYYPIKKAFFDDNGNIIVYSKTFIYLFDGKTGKLINSRSVNLGQNVAYHRSKIYAVSVGASSVICIDPKTLENEWETQAEIDYHTTIIPSGYSISVLTEKQIARFGLGTGKMLSSQKTDKLLSMRKTFEYAIVDRQVYATTLDWSFQKFTYRLSIKP